MHTFHYYCPTFIHFGEGEELNAGKYAKENGATRVMVVYGGRSAEKSGLLSRVLTSVEEAGLSYTTLGGVKPNPRLSLAREGVQKAKEFGVDFLLAIGGGSVIDTAKAIADGVANPDLDIWDDLWKKKAALTASLPVGVVLTIPAAGSESSDSAVLTNDETLEKRGLSSNLHRPRFAVMNPALTLTLPRHQLGCGVVDIMMHTMDRYFNPVTDNALTDAIAEALLRTVIENGRIALAGESADLKAMSEIMWAGSLSHNGLTGLGNVNDFAPHQLGHELSARFDVAHGASLSAVWGSWARYVIEANPERFAQFARNVWGLQGEDAMELGLQGIAANEKFFSSIDMPISIGQLSCGVQNEEVLKELAHSCAFTGTRKIGSFRVLDESEMLKIYEMANV